MARISFHQEDIKFELKRKTRIRTWIRAIIGKAKKEAGEITFIFCSDVYLLMLNQQFLNHDSFTDIITFDNTAENADGAISGDIFISVDRVRDNAFKFKTDAESEMHRVMIHGVLHLLGYKDKSAKAKAEMRKAEDKSLQMLRS